MDTKVLEFGNVDKESAVGEDVKDILGLKDVLGASESKEAGTQDKGTPNKLKGHVTRKEFVEIMQQISNNLNMINNYMMEDLNALYSQHLFPNEIKMSVMEDILIEKGLVTSEELIKRYNDKIALLNKQAQEIKAKEEASEKAKADSEAESENTEVSVTDGADSLKD